jgi:hypothetical protein
LRRRDRGWRRRATARYPGLRRDDPDCAAAVHFLFEFRLFPQCSSERLRSDCTLQAPVERVQGVAGIRQNDLNIH